MFAQNIDRGYLLEPPHRSFLLVKTAKMKRFERVPTIFCRYPFARRFKCENRPGIIFFTIFFLLRIGGMLTIICLFMVFSGALTYVT